MRTPGVEGLAKRPLHFIWICDCSGSMAADGKIQQLNHAIKEALPEIEKVSKTGDHEAILLMRAIKFSSGAEWINKDSTPIENYKWYDLDADGVTDLGKALSMVADELKMPPMEERGLPPVLILVSDGQPTDDFESGLNKLMAEPWGKKAVRVAIAIGSEADREVLQKFIGNSKIKLLEANNPQELVELIKWASTTATKIGIAPESAPTGDDIHLIPEPIKLDDKNPNQVVW